MLAVEEALARVLAQANPQQEVIEPALIDALGHVLAARPDLVGPQLAEELKDLRANVRPDDIEQAQAVVRSEAHVSVFKKIER